MRIYTIGHSTRSLEEFLEALRAYGIRTLADIRAFPGSTKYPHFGKASLERSLGAAGIRYVWMGEGLGGYRKRSEGLEAGSPNAGLRSRSFRNYADHMMGPAFRKAAAELVAMAELAPTAMMCAEKLYWRCHRLLVSDYLASLGHEVCHIIDEKSLAPHELSHAARVVDGVLSYPVVQAPDGGESRASANK